MTLLDTLGVTISHGLDYLTQHQEPDGSFVTFAEDEAASAKPLRTVLVPALMLHALVTVQSGEAKALRTKLAAWLTAQMQPDGGFSYWQRSTADTDPSVDLYTTFTALHALYLHDPSLIDEARLAGVAKLLIAAEIQVGGPYHSIVGPARPVHSVADLVTNGAINRFLSLIAKPLPLLESYMEEAICQQVFHSTYYYSPLQVAALVAQAYHGPKRHLLTRFVQEHATKGALQGTLGLASGLAICLHTGKSVDHPDIKAGVRQLLAAQGVDGSWVSASCLLATTEKGKVSRHGSAELTTAWVVGLLGYYASLPKGASATKQTIEAMPADNVDARMLSRKHQTASDKIYREARRFFQSFEESLSRPALKTLAHIQSADINHEIVLLPARFIDSLRHSPRLPTTLVHALGLANLYAWVAYTLYDDFLDDKGQPAHLPVANVAMRASVAHFRSLLPNHKGFQRLVAYTFDHIDNANAWEIAHCRFVLSDKGTAVQVASLPRYGMLQVLAERSLSHALPLLGVLAALGIDPKNAAAQNILTAMKHYLIGRQLNDDMHDWQEDLRAGHISPVGRSLLQGARVASGKHALDQLMPQLEQYFWDHTLEKMCQTVQKHAVTGRNCIQKSGLCQPGDYISSLLDAVEAVASRTLAEQAKINRFIQAYSQ